MDEYIERWSSKRIKGCGQCVVAPNWFILSVQCEIPKSIGQLSVSFNALKVARRNASKEVVAGKSMLKTFVGVEVQYRDSLLNGYAFTKVRARSSVG